MYFCKERNRQAHLFFQRKEQMVSGAAIALIDFQFFGAATATVMVRRVGPLSSLVCGAISEAL